MRPGEMHGLIGDRFLQRFLGNLRAAQTCRIAAEAREPAATAAKVSVSEVRETEEGHGKEVDKNVRGSATDGLRLIWQNEKSTH